MSESRQSPRRARVWVWLAVLLVVLAELGPLFAIFGPPFIMWRIMSSPSGSLIREYPRAFATYVEMAARANAVPTAQVYRGFAMNGGFSLVMLICAVLALRRNRWASWVIVGIAGLKASSELVTRLWELRMTPVMNVAGDLLGALYWAFIVYILLRKDVRALFQTGSATREQSGSAVAGSRSR